MTHHRRCATQGPAARRLVDRWYDRSGRLLWHVSFGHERMVALQGERGLVLAGHGLASLEIEGTYISMGIDADLVYDAEVTAILTSLGHT